MQKIAKAILLIAAGIGLFVLIFGIASEIDALIGTPDHPVQRNSGFSVIV